MILITLALALVLPQDARPSIDEVKSKHEGAILKIEGVIRITTGGASDDRRLVVQVTTEEVKREVLKLTGSALDGYKVQVVVTGEPPREPSEPPKAGSTKTAEKPTVTKEFDPLDDCDIVRDHRKLKALTHHKDGKTVANCAVSHRQQVGSAGGHNYVYTKHREDCPIRLGNIKEPADADAFLQWVFRLGFMPADRRGYLGFELKGSDSLWFSQVREDLTSRLPYIRQGAVWVAIREKSAGAGWRWEVPKPVSSELPPGLSK